METILCINVLICTDLIYLAGAFSLYAYYYINTISFDSEISNRINCIFVLYLDPVKRINKYINLFPGFRPIKLNSD